MKTNSCPEPAPQQTLGGLFGCTGGHRFCARYLRGCQLPLPSAVPGVLWRCQLLALCQCHPSCSARLSDTAPQGAAEGQGHPSLLQTPSKEGIASSRGVLISQKRLNKIQKPEHFWLETRKM